MATNIFAFKSSLRRSMLKTLRALSEPELQEQSERVTELLFDQPFYQNAQSIGCYLSMNKGELRTTGIVRDILSRNIPLYTPYLSPSSASSSTVAPLKSVSLYQPLSPTSSQLTSEALEQSEPDMKMLRLYSKADMDLCQLDKWGILDPRENRYDVEEGAEYRREDVMEGSVAPLDLILIPGVAFDENCNRLGRGKGYYDRFLLHYTSLKPRPLLVALALAPQILCKGEKVPTTEIDFILDGVISPEGIFWRKGVNA